MDNEIIHIGKAIRQKVAEKGIRISDFAHAIHCSNRNVYRIFKREFVDKQLLKDISRVLNSDFSITTHKAGTKRYIVIIETNQEQLQELTLKYRVVCTHCVT